MADIVNEAPATTRERIADAEREIGLEFPDAYRDFLLRHNGGEPRPREFIAMTPAGEAESGSVARLFAVDGQDGLLESWRAFHDRIPPGHIPVGADLTGNLILLAAKGGGAAGQVALWPRHGEASPGGASRNSANLHFIAADWERFLQALTTVE